MPNGSYNTFIHVEIGGLKLHETEDHTISVQHKRIASDLSSNVILTLYDDSAFAVESKILSGEKTFTYWYGYVNGKRSDKYEATITHMGGEMTGRGMMLTIEGVPSGLKKDKEVAITSYAGMTINEIVATIAVEQNWNIMVNVPCEVVPQEAGSNEPRTYLREGLGAQEFIEKVLCPDAVSVEGQGDYKLYIKSNDSGKFVWFMPVGYRTQEVSDTLTFVVGQDHESIISFSPEYDKYLAAMIGADGVKASALDAGSNDGISYDMLKKSVTDDDVRVNTIVTGSSYTENDIKNLAVNTWNKMINAFYKATLVLVGDPSIQPMTNIDIIVLTPSNVIHHSSGRYYIKSAEDMLDMGSYTTTLELTRVNSSDKTDVVATSSNTSSISTSTASSADAASLGIEDTIVNRALLSYRGIPYVWGGEDRSGADCSGFVYMAFSENNWGSQLSAYRGTVATQWQEMKKDTARFKKVSSQADLQSGDIIIMNGGAHIGFALGNGKMIHAPRTGDVIKVDSIWKFVEAYRYNGYPR